MKCTRCVNNIQTREPPSVSDCKSELTHWHHRGDKRGIPDPVLKQAWQAGITFVFHHHSHEKQKITV